jgi:hypothetical protein
MEEAGLAIGSAISTKSALRDWMHRVSPKPFVVE